MTVNKYKNTFLSVKPFLLLGYRVYGSYMPYVGMFAGCALLSEWIMKFKIGRLLLP
jgi:hypothetical protein